MKRTLRSAAPLLGILLFSVALFVLHRELERFTYRDVVHSLAAIPAGYRLLAAVLTVAAYAVLTGYDVLAMRFVGVTLAYRRIALASFVGQAFSNNLGFAVLSGGPVRYRLYSAWGLSTVDIAKVVAFTSFTLWLGFLTVAGGAFTVAPPALPAGLSLPTGSARTLGLVFLAAVAAYLAWTALRRLPLTVRGWEIALPAPGLALGQVAVASMDWTLAGAVLYALLPHTVPLGFVTFIAIFLLAQVAGVASQVPGGLGVFESVILVLLSPTVPTGAVLGALVGFRVLYYVLPLVAAAVLLGLREGIEHRAGVERIARALGQWVPWLVPNVLAFTTFLGGAILLVSGSTPAVHGRLAWLNGFLPLPVLELSHFLGSLAGAGLLILARGLQRRLDAAYVLTAALLGAGALFSLLKGLDYEEAAVLTVMLLALLPSRRHFYRKASLLGERISPGWAAAVALVVIGSTWLGFFSHKHVEYSSELWWRFALYSDAPRFLRASVAVFTVLLVYGMARLLRPAPPAGAEAGAEELDRVEGIVRGCADTSANLALLGDKSFLFSQTGDAFVMYGVEGRSWVAMGDPVGGSAAARSELAWRFRDLSDRHGGWTVFYEVGPDHVPLYLDLGLTLLKLGEEARVPLDGFSLEGHARKNLRHAHRKLLGEGWELTVVPAGEVPALLGDLKGVSDTWLEHKSTREKGFSLGFFGDSYLRRFDTAVVRREGRLVAFANLWSGAGREELSVDLMRHTPEAPNGIMDFLFVSLMLWGREQGYHWFNLGMAPLAGLENRAHAPLWNRIGALVFGRGRAIYNFQGLRNFKAKFDPVWRPRYLASPGGLALPVILTNIAALVSGGARGVLAK